MVKISCISHDLGGGLQTPSAVIADGAEQLNQLLADIRRTFAGESEADIEAVRRTLRRVFEWFTLYPVGHPDIPERDHTEVPAEGFVLIPKPRASMIADASPVYAAWADSENDLAPRLDRVPLDQGGATEPKGFTGVVHVAVFC